MRPGSSALAASVNIAPLALGRAGLRERPARQRRDRFARNAGAAADADRDKPAHGLTSRHCAIGIAGAPAGIAPDRLGMRDRDLRKLAAVARAPVDAGGLRLERHRVDDQPPAGRERADGALDHARRARAAADEDRVRRGQVRERLRRFAGDDREAGNAEAQRVAGDPRRPVVAGLDGDRAVGGVGEHPFDRDRARARADVPQEFRRAAARAGRASPRGSRAW